MGAFKDFVADAAKLQRTLKPKAIAAAEKALGTGTTLADFRAGGNDTLAIAHGTACDARGKPLGLAKTPYADPETHEKASDDKVHVVLWRANKNSAWKVMRLWAGAAGTPWDALAEHYRKHPPVPGAPPPPAPASAPKQAKRRITVAVQEEDDGNLFSWIGGKIKGLFS